MFSPLAIKRHGTGEDPDRRMNRRGRGLSRVPCRASDTLRALRYWQTPPRAFVKNGPIKFNGGFFLRAADQRRRITGLQRDANDGTVAHLEP